MKIRSLNPLPYFAHSHRSIRDGLLVPHHFHSFAQNLARYSFFAG